MGILVLDYQNNFADNLSEIAYGTIIKENSNCKYYFENDTLKRKNFESKISNFNVDIEYISKNRVSSITNKSYLFSRKLINKNSIKRDIFKKTDNDNILNIRHFKIDDINLVTKNLKENFSFNNKDFIVNHDILDEIKSTNAIGLYINSLDKDEINEEFIINAVKRLNKYLKKPVLYIFSNSSINISYSRLDCKYKLLNLYDWREEFYFLTQCRNKIINSSENSYSESVWSTVLKPFSFGITVFDKNLNVKNIPNNWIAV